MRVSDLKQWGSVLVVALAVCGTLSAAPAAPVADAAREGDIATVKRLLRDGGDVNAALGDGMTALHHAAMRGDADMAGVLLYAGANLRATTRLGGYTPLHLASQRGHEQVISLLVKAGANPNQPTVTGATPLMLAAASGHVAAVKQLVADKADLNAKEQANEQTALMFAAAFDRPEVVKLLVEVGADTNAVSKVLDVSQLTSPEEALQEEVRLATQKASAQAGGRAAPTPRNAKDEIGGVTRPFRYNELIGKQGGFTAIHYAARQGSAASVMALVDRQRPLRPGDEPARARRRSEHPQRGGCGPALRDHQHRMGAEIVLPAAAGPVAAAHQLPDLDESAPRQGSRPERAPAQEALVQPVQLRSASHRRGRRDRLLARRVRE
jgi:hypothetical protein